MSYICEKPAGSCPICAHYRYDDDYGGMACFAQPDEQAGIQKGEYEMISEKELKNREELFKLMRENPELPVIPMVDGEIPGDDCGYWLGSWGQAQVDEYLEAGDRFLFKSDDDVFDALERYMTCEEFGALPSSESECRPYYEKLPWKKAIVVYIVLPD